MWTCGFLREVRSREVRGEWRVAGGRDGGRGTLTCWGPLRLTSLVYLTTPFTATEILELVTPPFLHRIIQWQVVSLTPSPSALKISTLGRKKEPVKRVCSPARLPIS